MPVVQIDPLPHRTTKGEILELVSSKGGLDRRKIGRIELRGQSALVEVPEGWENRLVKALDGSKLGERKIRAWRVEDVTAADREVNREDENHFQRLARLLELEGQAEARQAAERMARLSAADAERSGNTLIGMTIDDEESGLGGRVVLRFSKRGKAAPLPWHRLNIGAPVLLSAVTQQRTAAGVRGIVCERGENYLRVAVEDALDEPSEPHTWRIDASQDEVARQRMRGALERARWASGDRLAELRKVLLGEKPPEFKAVNNYEPLDSGLNAAQQQAVQLALSARHVALIHGPPGTGKTTAVVELIRQAARRGQKVLATAPSNVGVDNMFERLLMAGERAVRLGHPARVLPHLRSHTLDLLVEDHPDVRRARKLVKDALELFRQADRHTRAKPAPGAKRNQRQEARELLADARRMEARAVEHILDTADVLCVTTTGIDSEVLGMREFDLAVIDEACQSTEPGCWIPLLRARRVILAGDHRQLPPTVVSAEAVAEGFNKSLFERLMEHHTEKGTQDEVSLRLNVQYRMHEQIMQFSSNEFYDGALVAHDSVSQHLLKDLSGVATASLTETAIEFIDTAGASYDEEQEPDGESRLNPREAGLVRRKVVELIAAGVPATGIAVIAPYAAQVRLLRQECKLHAADPEGIDFSGLEVDTVDGFQGREKEAVVISLVRSNPRGEVGFLADTRRMNVALTRARRKLIVIGDTATLSTNPFYQRLIDYFEEQLSYRTVWEEAEW